MYDAFRTAFASGARVITTSFNTQSPMDYKNAYKFPDDYLDLLATGLVENDQILVVSAGNFGYDITAQSKEGEALLQKAENMQGDDSASPIEKRYVVSGAAEKLHSRHLLQYAEHPILRERVVVVVNATQNADACSASKVTFQNGGTYDVGLAADSCTPGDNELFQGITVSAFGTGIRVAISEASYKTSAGTSLSVPMVGGLLSLMDEHYTTTGCRPTGPQLVNILKTTCVQGPSIPPSVFGHGFIDPLAFLTYSLDS